MDRGLDRGGLYRRLLLPRLTHLVCGASPIRRQRRKIVPEAAGDVLEIGIGSGLNFPFYDAATVRSVTGLDLSEALWRLRSDTARPFPTRFVLASAEAIPLDTASVDTVVTTYTLCSVRDLARALSECRRVLRPGGRLLFSEHGEAPDERVRRSQRRWNPLWGRLAGGCRLDVFVPRALERSGFRIERIESRYLPGWKPASYNFSGVATRADE